MAALLASMLVAAPWPVPAGDETEEGGLSIEAEQALLEELERLRASTRTFMGDFHETRHLPMLPSPLRFEGRIYYDREGLFFMEYEQPFRYILRVRGGEALIYIEGSETADVSNLSEAEGMDQADVFAWDPSRFEGTIRREAGGFRLIPSTGESPAPGISILLDPETLTMKGVRITGEGGDVTELEFFNVVINQPLPERVTGFELPPGVERHRMGLQ